MSATASDALRSWTRAQLGPTANDWLNGVLAKADSRHTIDIAFGMAPRKTSRDLLALSETDIERATTLIPGWQPHRWRIDEAVRLLIVLAGLEHDANTLDRLIRHADIDEQCAVYRGLCLMPAKVELNDAVGRGLRTHANPVFEAIAHHNPWTFANFDEHRWNHLVLKAMFMEVSLWPIQGFDERRNPELARMALDFADERRAADRPVPTELYRCAIPYATLADVRDRLSDLPVDAEGRWLDSSLTRALSLAATGASDQALADYIHSMSPHHDAMASGALSWSNHDTD